MNLEVLVRLANAVAQRGEGDLAGPKAYRMTSGWQCWDESAGLLRKTHPTSTNVKTESSCRCCLCEGANSGQQGRNGEYDERGP